MFSRGSLYVPKMFAGFFQNVFRMLRWVLWAWWNLMIISNESTDFNDPKELDDPQLFDDPSYLMIPSHSMIPRLFDGQLEVWTLIIQKSTVILPSFIVLFLVKIDFLISKVKNVRRVCSFAFPYLHMQ